MVTSMREKDCMRESTSSLCCTYCWTAAVSGLATGAGVPGLVTGRLPVFVSACRTTEVARSQSMKLPEAIRSPVPQSMTSIHGRSRSWVCTSRSGNA